MNRFRRWLHRVTRGDDLVEIKVTKKPGCFLAGTGVLTESGLKPIEEIKSGEKVWAVDPQTGEWELREVVAPLVHDYEGDIVAVTVGQETVEATGNHPFWVVEGLSLANRPMVRDVYPDERALTEQGRWVAARDLQVRDTVWLQSGQTATIVGLSTRQGRATVYNIVVEGLHTYAVGSLGVLVHNKPQADLPDGAGNGNPTIPDDYWKNKKAPTQVEPGTRRITEQKPSSRKQGEVYERTTHYDEHGRSTGQTHKTDPGEPDVHPNPHHHKRDPKTGQQSGPIPGEHPDY
jgi:hypothetical protein